MNFTNIKYNIALILLTGETSLSAAQEAAFDPAGRAYINGIRAEQFDLPFVANELAALQAAFDPAGRAYINGIRAEQFDLPFVAAYDAPNLPDAEPLVAAELAAHDAPDSPQPEYP